MTTSATYTISGIWGLNNSPHITTYESIRQSIDFISNGNTYDEFEINNDGVDAITYWKNNGGKTVYVNGDPPYWENEAFKIIEFTHTQEVSVEFYEWFTANATQQGGEASGSIVGRATITYNDEVIATLITGKIATLECAGMKMKGNVVITYIEESGGGESGGGESGGETDGDSKTIHGGLWHIRNLPTSPTSDLTANLTFTSNGVTYTQMRIVNATRYYPDILFGDTLVFCSGYYVEDPSWANNAYRTITIRADVSVSQDFYDWFVANAFMESGGSND